jgi:hypothetical protein
MAASVTAAASSATEAATSATSAAASATAAATSATSASTSASSASTSASSALTSANSASASATAAATSATSAAASATTAANSVATISGFATTASNSASAAATSAASASTSASSALTSATSAATSYDEFDDRYLGSKTTDPTVDNDGGALLTGALYFNSAIDAMKVYNGSSWDLVAPDTSNFIDKSILTAKGSLISASGASTPAQLTVAATNGYVLSVNSATATGLAWTELQAGSQVKIDGGAPATYDYIDFDGMGTSTATTGTVVVSPITVTDADPGKRIYVGTTTPSSPETGDVWIDESSETDPDLRTMTIMGAY